MLVAVQERVETMYKERIPQIIQQLHKLPDFRVELKWEFKSWVPLVSRLCPHDTYVIHKSGSRFRVDTTLTGFKNMMWQRGDVSLLFNSGGKGDIMILDNASSMFAHQEVKGIDILDQAEVNQAVQDALTRNCLRVDASLEEATFQPHTSWFGTPHSLQLGPFHTLQYSLTNLHYLTTTRHKDSRPSPSDQLTLPESYFDWDHSLTNHPNSNSTVNNKVKGNGLLHPHEKVTVKKKPLNASVWLAQDFPHSLEQLLPIFQVLAPTHKHFDKLNTFLQLAMPQGFPLKIEIPVVPTLSAQVTILQFEDMLPPEHLFQIPSHYQNGAIDLIFDF
eukprot:TRINITY_DN7130_c0_g1_i2.p1 TRINITY_DN7130_c0_g1~~TRINITY_DN7130_c0_g1_i2.p1  ORF type:complete len:332 (-),score=57.58 TRINITY_DN7130_c0_g1_i2:99-1094(-)